MANEQNLRPFRLGQSGNPAGRPPEAAREAKQYTKAVTTEAFNRLIGLTEAELVEIARRSDSPGIDKVVARVITKCIAQGTFGEFDKILDRIIGKVSQKFEGELGAPGGIPLTPPVIHYYGISPEDKGMLPHE